MDHAVIGGVVAVVVFAMLCLLIVLGRYFARHKGKSWVDLTEHRFNKGDERVGQDRGLVL